MREFEQAHVLKKTGVNVGSSQGMESFGPVCILFSCSRVLSCRRVSKYANMMRKTCTTPIRFKPFQALNT